MANRIKVSCLVVCLAASAFMASTSSSYAAEVSSGLEVKAVVDERWEEKADTNNDGIVDAVEIKQWKERHKNGSQVDTGWELKADTNNDGIIDKTEKHQWIERHRKDKDNNPPGAAGGAGTNWENPPGAAGGPGASPDVKTVPPLPPLRRDLDNNPPGATGGAGTNWENPPGPKGGPGTSPNKKPAGGRR